MSIVCSNTEKSLINKLKRQVIIKWSLSAYAMSQIQNKEEEEEISN